MSPRKIKAALVMNAVKQAEIARLVGLSPQMVFDVIAGNRRNIGIETAIANAIGKPVEEVFPVAQPTSASSAA